MKGKKIYDYTVSGYYGFHNTGDDAVLDVLIREIRVREPGAVIAVITQNEYPTLKKSGVKFIDRRSIPETLTALYHTRTLIFGGGSLLQDVTSRRSLAYYALILKAGHCLCDRVHIFSNGIGPLGIAGEKTVSRLLSSADSVSVRDPFSFCEAVRMGADPASVTLGADPVFLMERDAGGEKLLSDFGIGGKFFAVSLRSFSESEDFSQIIVFCEKMKKKGLLPLFFPMQESADGEICRRAAKACGGAVFSGKSAGEILSVLSLAEFSVGMRLHFLLLSLMAEKPTVALSYDVKIDSTVPYAGGEFVLPAKASAHEIESAVSKAEKSTDGEFLRRRCMEMRSLAKRDMDGILRPHTLVKTLYSKSV